MRFKVRCQIFLFFLSSEKFGEIFGVVHPLIHCHVTLWGGGGGGGGRILDYGVGSLALRG